MNCVPNFWRRWNRNTVPEESLNQCIERLSALPPRKRLEAYRAIPDPEFRRQVVMGLRGSIHADMMAESMVENLNRNVRERMAAQKPSQAA